MINKITTILKLIKNLLVRKSHYTLHFTAERDRLGNKHWYYDFKNWGFDHANLEMVSGADKLCEEYADGKDEVTINIIASKRQKPYLKTEVREEFIAVKPKDKNLSFADKYLLGMSYYAVNDYGTMREMWICPVTLFVLGRYPNYLYISKANGKH